jgi:GMP synthase-like glutamine amidotransferase
MKILLVNNHTRHVKQLNEALVGHEVEMQMYQPGLDFHTAGKDLVILSGGGGEGKELTDKHKPTNKLWYEDEMDFVLSTNKPVLGICMGFEVIAAAYGAKLSEMPKKGLEHYDTVKTTFKGWSKFKKLKLRQFEAHDFCIKYIPSKDFEILAESKTGIEIIRHKTRPMLATQFHPEFPSGTLELKSLVKSFT